ncbi:hypothetical protein DL93DRAFT_2080597 [Clavulina sp. PMI_390]|nr:hypothetical protein DL93DRAFT_2080597 [Clavulina sp. PMI_390]
MLSLRHFLLALLPVLLDTPRTAMAQSLNPLPMGANCTADADCASSKCWPEYWYFGQTICSPSATGHGCFDASDCVTGVCDNYVCGEGIDYESKCYSGADCQTDVCIAPYLGGGQYTECFPMHTGMACQTAEPSLCISGICTDDGSGNGTGVCAPSGLYGNCYTGADCESGYFCDPRSMSDPVGGCYKD